MYSQQVSLFHSNVAQVVKHVGHDVTWVSAFDSVCVPWATWLFRLGPEAARRLQLHLEDAETARADAGGSSVCWRVQAKLRREMYLPRPLFRPPPGLEHMGGLQCLQSSNTGSFGHPQLCQRPCVHIAKTGSCRAGAACRYCHEMHQKPPLKLSSNQRELMRSMMEEDVRTLLRPHIDRKLRQLELTDQAAILMNLLEQEAHSDEEQFFANVTKGTVRMINPVLARLPLLALAARL